MTSALQFKEGFDELIKSLNSFHSQLNELSKQYDPIIAALSNLHSLSPSDSPFPLASDLFEDLKKGTEKAHKQWGESLILPLQDMAKSKIGREDFSSMSTIFSSTITTHNNLLDELKHQPIRRISSDNYSHSPPSSPTSNTLPPPSSTPAPSPTTSSTGSPSPFQRAPSSSRRPPPPNPQQTSRIGGRQRSTTRDDLGLVVVVSSFTAQKENEVDLQKGDVLHLLDDDDPNWWIGALHLKLAVFPKSCVKKLPPSVPTLPAPPIPPRERRNSGGGEVRGGWGRTQGGGFEEKREMMKNIKMKSQPRMGERFGKLK